ncbi:MAG: right-handed parallel beta-helix repeat-containing protein [Lachnospirales bacterium]
MIVPIPNSRLKENTVFLAGVYYSFYNNNGILIEDVDNIVIDGYNSLLVGGKNIVKIENETNKEEFSYGYGEMKNSNLGYKDVAITLRNCNNITIKNIKAKGFEIGLLMENCNSCTIEDNDFSYNYHNPDWGWDEHYDLGGIIVKNSNYNIIRNNKATNVWSALVLYMSNNNKVINNDLSHTSNVGLRLWLSSHNEFKENDFSYGIRKKPDEIHARDSSCVLIESASNYNYFIKNDMRYGGDGLFIRSLNNMVSEYNVFIENDASFANNNAFEAWDANNIYIRNKANCSSYGFWLGNSDNTILLENEVMYNGHSFKNAPESFGNAGIACVNGSGSNFIIDSNKIACNNGPGIALRFKDEHKIRNVLVKNNEIISNFTDSRGYVGYGVFLEKACNIYFVNNLIEENQGEKIFQNKDTYNINVIENEAQNYKTAFIEISSNATSYVKGNSYKFSIPKEYENALYIINEKEYIRDLDFEFTFRKSGKYSIEVVAYKGEEVHVGYKFLYVTEKADTLLGFLDIENWKTDGTINSEYVKEKNKITKLFGANGLIFTKENSKSLFMEVDVKPFNFSPVEDTIRLYMRYNNDFIDWHKEVRSPVVEFIGSSGVCKLTPKECILSKVYEENTENRYDLHYIDISKEFFNVEGYDNTVVNKIKILWETKIFSNFDILICGVDVLKLEKDVRNNVAYFDDNSVGYENNYINGTNSLDNYNMYKILSNQKFAGDRLDGYATGSGEDKLTINFPAKIFISSLKLNFYDDKQNFFLPDGLEVIFNEKPLNIKSIFEEVFIEINEVIDGVTFIFNKASKMLLYNLEIYNNNILKDIEYIAEYKENEVVDVDNIKVKLNIEYNDDFSNKSKLIYELFEENEDILSSKCIAKGLVEIKDNGEYSLPINKQILKDKKYFFALSQEIIAKSMSIGKYFRWVGSGLSKKDGTYFYINGDFIENDVKKVGWGKCYLKINNKDKVYNFSSPNESLGNRFGLLNMEKISQRFVVENDFKYAINPNFVSNYICECNKEFTFTLTPKEDTTINIHLLKGTGNIFNNDSKLKIENNIISIVLKKGVKTAFCNKVTDDVILYISNFNFAH